MKTLVMGILLFFLFIGFKEGALFSESINSQEENGRVTIAEGVVKKASVLTSGYGSHDTICSPVTKTALQLNFIPDVRVQLATGEHIQLQQLMDQKKYIFINIWLEKKGAGVEDVSVVDSIGEFYKNKLLVIGLLDEANLIQLKRLIKKHRLKSVQGLVSADIKKYLKVNVYPYGILFSKTGKLIDAGMDTKKLAAYMEKHVVMSRAKF
jgi:hypothetical protein